MIDVELVTDRAAPAPDWDATVADTVIVCAAVVAAGTAMRTHA
ncbi:hypothetical protein LBMAG38_15320 [Chloroflexota bacterium]|nr:hypothetical protein LBMAG38_15320 [Chloroflexota bacterium]